MTINMSAMFLPEDGVALGTVAMLFGVGVFNLIAQDVATIALFVCIVAARVTNIWIMYPLQTSAELNFVMYYTLILYWVPFFPLVLLYGGDVVRMLSTFIVAVPAVMAIDVYSSGVYPDLPLTSKKQAGWVLSTFCFSFTTIYVVKNETQHRGVLVMGLLGILAGMIISFVQSSVPQGIAAAALLVDLVVTELYVATKPGKIFAALMEAPSHDKTKSDE